MEHKNEPATNITLTNDQFSAILDKLGDKFIAAVQEMKKLPPHEQEKFDRDQKKAAEYRVGRLRESISEQRAKDTTQFACEVGGHKKHNVGVPSPAHAFRGQVNNDGSFRALCIRCYKAFPKVKATDEQIRTGLGLQNIAGLTPAVLYEWHKRSYPDCPECKQGDCAVKMARELKQGHLDPLPTVTPEGKVVKPTAEQVLGVA